MLRGLVVVTVSRRRIGWAIALGAAALCAWFSLGWVKPVTAPFADAVSGRIVAIDAGHGGPDPGAVSPSGAREKDITLAVALKLQQILHRGAVYTVMTRTGDYDLVRGDATGHRQREDLSRRATLVNGSGADLLVSLHANSYPSPAWSGAQTFYLEGRKDAERLARRVQEALVQTLGPNRREARPADLFLLRQVRVPAVVVELGFLSHPREEQWLQQEEYQWRLARAVADGILAFLTEEYLARTGSGPRSGKPPAR
ncbi:MAG: N-acetylmuramoyl-L-alanine amidase [Firmicutes bacterium]|nr:N-acetylmuramoyl-L-alanine amidase [Bacillota bacterium]